MKLAKRKKNFDSNAELRDFNEISNFDLEFEIWNETLKKIYNGNTHNEVRGVRKEKTLETMSRNSI